MIVMGFPGIGKSSMACYGFMYIDLDSGIFKKDLKNFYEPEFAPIPWWKYYCRLAKSLSDQGYIVFVSSHREVQEEFAENYDLDGIYICYPARELKSQWIGKLATRYANVPTNNNLRALIGVHNFDDIVEMAEKSPFKKIVLESMDYDLDRLISEASKPKIERKMKTN